jgi:hypothetical protein
MILSVGNRDIPYFDDLVIPVIHLETNGLFPIEKNGYQGRPDKGKKRAECLGGSVDPVYDFSAKPKTCDVMEITCAWDVTVVPITEASNVYQTRMT